MRRFCYWVSLGLFLSLGCSSVRVQTDARVVGNAQLRQRLAGPHYVIRGPDEQTEASLAFQEFASILGAALEMRHPDLHRVDLRDPAEFALLLQVNVADLGAGAVSTPVYGHCDGYGYGPCGPMHYSSFGVVGTRVDAVHLGYRQTLMLSAYILDPDGPGGRRVLWEGAAGAVVDEPDIAPTIPYLALALTSYFGESSDGPRSTRYTNHSDDVKMLRSWIGSGGSPASRPSSQPESDN